MKRTLLFFWVLLMIILPPWWPRVSAAPPGPNAMLNTVSSGIISSPLSALLKWVWDSSAVTPKTDRNYRQFESGYVVETVLEGSKLGIDPYTIEVSPDGELLILDSENSNILRLTPPLSRYSRARLVAGSSQGYLGHVDGRPKDARFNHPRGFTVDDRGNIYVADTMNMAIRKIGEAGVTTIAGDTSNRAGHVDGPSENAKFSSDFDVVYVSSTCSLLVVDRGNQAIREIALQYDNCPYNYAASYPSGILMVAGAVSVGYILGLLQQQGFGGTIFSRKARQNKPPKKNLPNSGTANRPSLIPVDGQPENVDAGWMSFGKFILDIFKFGAEIIGGIFTYLGNFIIRKNPQKKEGLRPLRDDLHIVDDDIDPQPMSRNHQKRGDLHPLRDTLHVPHDDPKPKESPVMKNFVNFQDVDDHVPTPEPLKVQKGRVQPTRDIKGSSNYTEFKFQNNIIRDHRGEDQNHWRTLRRQQSSPQTYYQQRHDSRDEVVFGAVQEAGGENETVDIKPVDYGDPMYNHFNIRSRVGYNNLFDF